MNQAHFTCYRTLLVLEIPCVCRNQGFCGTCETSEMSTMSQGGPQTVGEQLSHLSIHL